MAEPAAGDSATRNAAPRAPVVAIVDDDPAIRLTGPGRSPRLPRTLTQGQVETLLAAVPAHGATEAERA